MGGRLPLFRRQQFDCPSHFLLPRVTNYKPVLSEEPLVLRVGRNNLNRVEVPLPPVIGQDNTAESRNLNTHWFFKS